MMQQIGWSPRKGGKVPTVESDRLCSLFDGALGSLVLYRFEKEQYVQQLEGCVPHSNHTCTQKVHIPETHARRKQATITTVPHCQPYMHAKPNQ